MHHSLRCHGQTLWLVDRRARDEFTRRHAVGKPWDTRQALFTLRQVNPEALLEVFVEHPLLQRRLGQDPQRVLERIAGAIEAGTLLLFAEPERDLPLVLDEPEDLLAGYDEHEPLLELPRHWIEVRLVDEDEQPRNGEHYRVVLADGTEITGQLDRNGITRIPDVPGGPCRWSFPELHPDEWDLAS